MAEDDLEAATLSQTVTPWALVPRVQDPAQRIAELKTTS
jgi:hypothetical protein